jgi:hypothetical protein
MPGKDAAGKRVPPNIDRAASRSSNRIASLRAIAMPRSVTANREYWHFPTQIKKEPCMPDAGMISASLPIG